MAAMVDSGVVVDDGISLAMKALKKTTDSKLKAENVDIAEITKGKKLKVLSDEEVNKYLSKA